MGGLLLDTHIAIWVIEDSPNLSTVARARIDSSPGRCYFSSISAWEIAVKRAVRPDAFAFSSQEFVELCEESGLIGLPLKNGHIYEVDALPLHDDHRDPFDRLILAQARYQGLTLLTHDRAFEHDGTDVIALV